MTPSNRSRGKRGGVLIVVVCLAVLILGIVGIAGQMNASGLTGAADRIAVDAAAERLARLALDEAEEAIRTEATATGTPWWTALRQPCLSGLLFDPCETRLDLPRTMRMAADAGQTARELWASAKLVRQDPLGIDSGSRRFGGDESFGTIAIRARVRLESHLLNPFSRDRTFELVRLVGFRTTAPEPPPPFDQSPLWVEDAVFLREQAAEIARRAGAKEAQIDRIRNEKPELFYARPDKDAATADELGLDLARIGSGSQAEAQVEDYERRFKAGYRYLKEQAVQANMRDIYWPQLERDAFLGRELGRADRVFASDGQLKAFLGNGEAHLSGIWFVAGPLTADFRYSGRGTIVSAGKLRVLRAERVDVGGALTLVSVSSDVDLSEAPGTVEAALIATRGTVSGLSGRTVKGLVVAARLSKGFEAGSATRVELDRRLTAHDPRTMLASSDRLEAHCDPVALAQFRAPGP